MNADVYFSTGIGFDGHNMLHYVGFENFPVLKEVFESSYDKVTIADLNPSENRPIVLWGMSYFKYPERN